MASFFDNVINWGIPVGVVLFLCSLFYTKFKGTFDALFHGIKNFLGVAFGSAASKSKEAMQDSYEMRYKYGPD